MLTKFEGYDNCIKFWSAHTGACTRTHQHPDSQVTWNSITPKMGFRLWFEINWTPGH